LNRGKILSAIPKIGGMRVEEAKKFIIRYMDEERISDRLYDLSVKPIFCRCGTEVVVRAVKGQWFIDYGNPEWKALAKKCVDQMMTAPQEYKRELPAIIDWLDARPCVRRRGFGTKFPFDETWTIEALSDSTMYMAFYPIAENINKGVITKDQLNDAFFDYVYLGKGDMDKAANGSQMSVDTLNKVRHDFTSRYPLDLNVGGIEHKSVHFPFSIFTHTAILPEEQWPKGIFLNWHVVSEGEKMSKHKGNTVYWDQAIKELGSDAVRLYVSYGANQWSDFDWKAVNAERHSKQVQEYSAKAQRLLSSSESKEAEIIDTWLASKLNSRIDEVTASMDSFEIRKTIQVAFYEMNNDLSWYEQRGGKNNELVKQFLSTQASMLYPFMPDVSAEVLKQMNKEPLQNGWPTSNKSLINKKSEDIEKSVAGTMDDIRNIVKLVKNGKELYLYVTTDMEKKAYTESLEMARIASGISNVNVYRVNDSDIFDPEGKAKKAKFMRPGIFIATEEKRKSTA
ncbi:MAG: class I tRNA ligase family protein, partial [Candidatus Micrarchaeota archaeon]|nr:class I tRNA ligase family protein [Candidatus Micrarchaeota archaeon]